MYLYSPADRLDRNEFKCHQGSLRFSDAIFESSAFTVCMMFTQNSFKDRNLFRLKFKCFMYICIVKYFTKRLNVRVQSDYLSSVGYKLKKKYPINSEVTHEIIFK